MKFKQNLQFIIKLIILKKLIRIHSYFSELNKNFIIIADMLSQPIPSRKININFGLKQVI